MSNFVKTLFYVIKIRTTNIIIIKINNQNVPPIRARGLVAIPEFSVICVSLMSGELMFYDMSSGRFKLCLEVNLGDCMLSTCLVHVYAFNKRQKTGSSKIAIGDKDGSVVVLEFLSSDEWNPF